MADVFIGRGKLGTETDIYTRENTMMLPQTKGHQDLFASTHQRHRAGWQAVPLSPQEVANPVYTLISDF